MNYENIAYASKTIEILLKQKHAAQIFLYADRQTHARPLLRESKALNIYHISTEQVLIFIQRVKI